jgi:hypothetical protein
MGPQALTTNKKDKKGQNRNRRDKAIMRVIKDKWDNPDHIGHLPAHRAKPITRSEIVVRHICKHCIHITVALIMAYAPVLAVEATRPEWGPMIDHVGISAQYK